MTYKEALSYGTDILTRAGIEEATLDAWLLLEYQTGMSRSAYFLHENDTMDEEQKSHYCADIEQRSKRIPLQHITGEQEFMGLKFQVNEHVLIPRQDTEILVEEAQKYLHSDMRVLDMCTGSGCIIISLADTAKIKRMEHVTCVGVDLSAEALEVSKQNAEHLEVDVTFIQSDLFEQVEEKYDLIVSNPPYIRTDVIEGLQEEVKLHDPYMALDGKEDGLFFYRKIIEEGKRYLQSGARLLFEIGYDQGMGVTELMEKAGYSGIVVKKDLAGLDRVVIGVYNC